MTESDYYRRRAAFQFRLADESADKASAASHRQLGQLLQERSNQLDQGGSALAAAH